MKAVAERASLAGVIAALAAAPGRGPSVARVAGQAVEFVCKYYKVGGGYISCSGEWVALFFGLCCGGQAIVSASITHPTHTRKVMLLWLLACRRS